MALSKCAACWRWLFQMWKMWRFACSQYVLMYSPDGANVYGSRGREGGVGERGWKLQNRVPMGGLPIHLLRHFLYRMYHLATVHFITDREMNRQTDDSITPIADHTARRSRIGLKSINVPTQRYNCCAAYLSPPLAASYISQVTQTADVSESVASSSSAGAQSGQCSVQVN